MAGCPQSGARVGPDGVDARTVELEAVAATPDGEGAADGLVVAAVLQTSSIPSDGGFGWVAPESPDPQTQASRAPLPTRAEAAPLEDQVHPPCPSPCQYPQYSG